MAGITLYDYQKDALERMKIGCILCGGVGSAKIAGVGTSALLAVSCKPEKQALWSG